MNSIFKITEVIKNLGFAILIAEVAVIPYLNGM